MKLISVNVGLPREIVWKGRHITTGIFKEPVTGRVGVKRLNLDGDRQADLTVHGGRDKAIYAYPSEHYARWRDELSEAELNWGAFGENLTTAGLDEDSVNIGDCFRIGSAVVQVTQPRLPCFKLAAKFQRDDILKRMLQSGRTGFYFAVLEEGALAVNDVLELLSRDESHVTVAAVVRLYWGHEEDVALLAKATRLPALPSSWREHFQRQLAARHET